VKQKEEELRKKEEELNIREQKIRERESTLRISPPFHSNFSSNPPPTLISSGSFPSQLNTPSPLQNFPVAMNMQAPFAKENSLYNMNQGCFNPGNFK
jgi:hypothetical protein